MGRKKIPISEEKKVVVKSLVDSGMPYRDIRKVVGDISQGYISLIVKEFETSKPVVEWYKKNKADVLLKCQVDDLELQSAIKQTIKYSDVEEWTTEQKQKWFSALAIDHAIKYDKERLESGQSTENVGVVVKAIHEWKKLKENSDGTG